MSHPKQNQPKPGRQRGRAVGVRSQQENRVGSGGPGTDQADRTVLEARRAKTRALKQGMMQELLTGRTRLV